MNTKFKFLPWCSDSRIVLKKENGKNIDIIADLGNRLFFCKKYLQCSVNFDKIKKKIIVKSIKGPLKN